MYRKETVNVRLIGDYFKGIWRDRYVLGNFVQSDLMLKYRKSVLGVIWAVITPLSLAIIIGLIYSILFGMALEEFIPLLLASINPWIFISSSAEASTVAFIAAEGYLKQSNVNPQIYPPRMVLTSFVNLMYSIVTFFAIYLFINPEAFGVTMLLTFPGLLVMFLFVLGFANIASVFNIVVRDYAPFQSIVLQAFFYITPIIYSTEMLDARGKAWVYKINPFYYIIEIVRAPMLGKEIPGLQTYCIAIGITAIVFISSVILLMKYKDKIVYRL